MPSDWRETGGAREGAALVEFGLDVFGFAFFLVGGKVVFKVVGGAATILLL